MKRGRILVEGKALDVTAAADGQVVLPDGRQVADSDVQWLLPMEFGTIIALDLNCADHVKALSGELTVVIGKSAKRVKAADAMDYVAGYTVCNDYAVRDYLENYYRPNLRVKNRDACTVIGPWLVDAADVADPHALALSTRVHKHLGLTVQIDEAPGQVYDPKHSTLHPLFS